jgi:hypothetical protein
MHMTDMRYMRPGLEFAMGKAVEEAGEFLAAMGKTMRWGFSSTNPEKGPLSETNAEWLRRELADLRGALANLEKEMTYEQMTNFKSGNELVPGS